MGRPRPHRPPSRAAPTARPDRGFALVLVLWTVVVLALIAGAFGASARTEMALARNIIAGARAEALADAGVHWAISRLLASADVPAPPLDGTPGTWSFGGGTVRVAIADENGKIDVNRASPELLALLFESVGVPPGAGRDLADAIVERRAPAPRDRPRRRTGLSTRLATPLAAAEGQLAGTLGFIEDLMGIPGLSPELYHRIAPFVTVHANRASPNLAVAPPHLRELLADGLPAEEGRGPSRRGSARDADDAPTGGPEAPGEERPAGARPEGAPASTYRIHAEARTADGGSFLRAAVVAYTGGSFAAYRIVGWSQGPRDDFPPDDGPIGDGAPADRPPD